MKKKIFVGLLALFFLSVSIAYAQPPLRGANYDDSVAAEASTIAKASAGTLYLITGYNAGGAQFVQVHNSATVPTDSAVPAISFAVAATANFTYDLTGIGRWCSAGIVVCNSSTVATKTLGGTDCWFNVWYK